MNRISKIILALTLAAALVLPVGASSVSEAKIIEQTPVVTEGDYQQTAGAEKLESVILSLKERFPETDSYDTFDYNISEGSDGVSVFSLSWSDSTGEKDSLYIEVNEKNFIYYYTNDGVITYNWNSVPAIPAISKGDAVDTAIAFLKKAAPDYKDDFDADFASVSYRRYSSAYNVVLTRVRNGYKIDDESVSITVTADGKVASYNAYSITNNLEAKSARATKSDAQLIELFKKYLPMMLRYTSVYNDETEKYEVVLSYFTSDDDKVIDARTGKLYSVEYEYGGNIAEGGDNMATTDMDAVTEETAVEKPALSKAESSAVESYAGMLTASDVTALIKKNGSLKFDDRLKVSYSRIYSVTSSYSDKITYNLNVGYNYSDDDNYIGAYVSVDAKTGEFISYNYYDGNYTDYAKASDETAVEINQLTFDDAKPLAADILGVMYPDTFAEYIRETEEWGDETYGSITYYRNVNGIPFENDAIFVTIERESGLITSLSMNYTTDAAFAKPDGIIDADTAVEKYFEASPVEREYLVYFAKTEDTYTVDTYSQSTTEKKTALVTAYQDSFRIDAFTGEALSLWSNEAYEYVPAAYYDKSVETKLASHAAAEKLLAIYNLGALDADAAFDPDAAITGEAYKVMLDLLPDYYEGEFGDTITRTEAVAAFIDALGYGKLAAISEIFVPNDKVTVSAEYTGYFAIAGALGLLDDFGEDAYAEMTYADAASLVYNYIVNNQPETTEDDGIQLIDKNVEVEEVVEEEFIG